MHGRLLLPLTAAALVLVPAGSAAAAASRACTPDDLQGTRAPAMLGDYGLDTQDGPLTAGTRYRVVVVLERANGDRGQAVEGSVAVSAPDGPPLDPTNEEGRPAWDFTPTQGGTLRMVVSWEQEVGPSGSSDVCAASQSFDLTVLAPTRPKVTGRFRRGAGSLEGSNFNLRLSGKAPQEPGRVTVVLRARAGTTTPPPATGRAFATFAFTPNGNGGFTSRVATRRLARTFQADTTSTGVRIFAYPNIAFGRTLRFAFSMEVLQDGRRIGGMRSGASCRRVQFRRRSAVKCRPVGLRQTP